VGAKAYRVIRRLIDRNPDAKPEEIIAAFKDKFHLDYDAGDTGLPDAMISEWLYPIVQKQLKARPLSKTERAFVKVAIKKTKVRQAERALADAYIASFSKN
jgi:hypothetical protein